MTALDTLIDDWHLSQGDLPQREMVRRLLQGMAEVPYENLTKLLSDGQRRCEEQVARDHLEYGTGGTCFSLVRLFLKLARTLGLEAQPILADRSYGRNTHCAAVVETGNGRLLADPGFLIHQPVRLDGEQLIELPHTTLRLSDDGTVSTVYPDGHEKFRYELHDQLSSDDDFRDLWMHSFDWDMMDQLVINRVIEDTHLYLRDTYLHKNRRNEHEQMEVETAQLVDRITQMGIDRSVAVSATAELGYC